MKKSIVAFVSAVLLSVSFGAASAQVDCGKMGGGMGMMGQGMGQMGMGRGMMGQGMMHMTALGLDSSQRAAVSGIMSRTMKDMVRKRAEMQIAAIELNELLAGDPVDMKVVEAALRKMETMRTEMRLSHIKARMEIMSILTPKQKRKFNELMMRRPMMMGMGGRGMMGGGRGMGMMRGMECGQCMMGGMSGMGGMMMDGMGDDMDDDDMDDDMMMEPSADMKGKKDEHREYSH